MLARLDAEADDRLLAERLGSFQPVQALDQNEARAIGTYKDGCLLAIREHALGDLLNAFWIEGSPPFDGHVNGVDRKIFALHHNAAKPSMLCAMYELYDGRPFFCACALPT